jgi:dUTP pyrophosphatase
MQHYVRTRLLRNSDFSNPIELSQHPDLTLEVLREKKDLIPFSQTHPNFTFEWVAEFPERFWNWNDLSSRAPFQFILDHPFFPWTWRILTERASKDFMIAHEHLQWDFSTWIPKKITVDDLEFLRIFKDRIPNYKWLILGSRTSWTVFMQSLDLPWLLMADVIPLDDFSSEHHVWFLYTYGFLFDWVRLSISLHIDIINAHPTLNWQRDYIQWNFSTWTTPVEPIEVSIREWVAANTIKKYWKRAISCPEFRMCRARLLEEFKDFDSLQRRKEMATVKFIKLSPHATIPSKATPGSIGLDLYSIDSYIVMPGQRIVVSTGLRVLLPDGVYGRIAPRSGLAVKHGLDVGAGVIDPDYTGEVRVVLFNHDMLNPFIIKPGYRIAQLILERALDPVVSEETGEGGDSSRGANGFGSSGI